MKTATCAKNLKGVRNKLLFNGRNLEILLVLVTFKGFTTKHWWGSGKKCNVEMINSSFIQKYAQKKEIFSVYNQFQILQGVIEQDWAV